MFYKASNSNDFSPISPSVCEERKEEEEREKEKKKKKERVRSKWFESRNC